LPYALAPFVRTKRARRQRVHRILARVS